MMRALILATALCLATVTGLRAATAAPAPQIGDAKIDRMLFLDGTLLLPPGEWIVAAVAVGKAAELDGADLMTVVLLQPHDGQVTSAILAQGNVAPLKNRPSLSSECWSEQAYFSAVVADDESGGACAAVLAVAGQPKDSDAWAQASAFATSHGWHMPTGFVLAALRSVDRTRLMDVRYAAAVPDAVTQGAAGACTWAVPAAEGPALIKQLSQSLTNFAETLLPVFEMTGHSQLATLGPAPPLTEAKAAPDTLLFQLEQARIDGLVENGALSQAQADVLSQRAGEPTASDPLLKQLLWRSGYKTLTYKAAAYIDTTAIYYLFVPDLPLVMVSSAITNVLGAPIVYLNDVAWSYFGLKASRSKQPFALSSLGTTCSRQ